MKCIIISGNETAAEKIIEYKGVAMFHQPTGKGEGYWINDGNILYCGHVEYLAYEKFHERVLKKLKAELHEAA